MNNQSGFWVWGSVVCLALIVGVSVYRSYRAMSEQVQEDRRVIGSLKDDINIINRQLVTIKDKLNKISQRSPTFTFAPLPLDLAGPPPRRPGFGPNHPRQFGTDLAAEGDAGDRFVPPPGTSAPSVNSEQATAYRKELIHRNVALHEEDRLNYGDQVTELYQAAHTDPRMQGDSQVSEIAFQQLVKEYPQSNATGMLISEKALQAARQANTVLAEQYYQSLSSNANFSSIVTDGGVEAKPALQSYLAYQYIQQNRFSEATTLIQSLQNNYGSGQIATPGPQGMVMQPVANVVKSLQAQLTEATGTK